MSAGCAGNSAIRPKTVPKRVKERGKRENPENPQVNPGGSKVLVGSVVHQAMDLGSAPRKEPDKVWDH